MSQDSFTLTLRGYTDPHLSPSGRGLWLNSTTSLPAPSGGSGGGGVRWLMVWTPSPWIGWPAAPPPLSRWKEDRHHVWKLYFPSHYVRGRQKLLIKFSDEDETFYHSEFQPPSLISNCKLLRMVFPCTPCLRITLVVACHNSKILFHVLQDVGTSHLCDGLYEQSLGNGLNTLVLWNNQITYQSMPSLARSLVSSLHVLYVCCPCVYFVETESGLRLDEPIVLFVCPVPFS